MNRLCLCPRNSSKKFDGDFMMRIGREGKNINFWEERGKTSTFGERGEKHQLLGREGEKREKLSEEGIDVT